MDGGDDGKQSGDDAGGDVPGRTDTDNSLGSWGAPEASGSGGWGTGWSPDYYHDVPVAQRTDGDGDDQPAGASMPAAAAAPVDAGAPTPAEEAAPPPSWVELPRRTHSGVKRRRLSTDGEDRPIPRSAV